jgi:hypothetical protein
MKAAVRAGAAPADLGQSLAYAAALRVARFGNANEHADWETAHHVFTYANALHQMLKRIGTANADGQVTIERDVLDADRHADRQVPTRRLRGSLALRPIGSLSRPGRPLS